MSGVTAGRFALAAQQVGGMLQLAGGISAYRNAQAYGAMAREAGEIAKQKFLRRTVKKVGTQKMKAIAGGVSPWSGSPRHVILDTLQDDSQDAAMIALGYEITARNAEREGTAAAIQGAAGFIGTTAQSFLTAHGAGLFKGGFIRGVLGLPPGRQKLPAPSTSPPRVPTLMTGSTSPGTFSPNVLGRP